MRELSLLIALVVVVVFGLEGEWDAYIEGVG